MAELPELGKHCEVSFCSKLDFLPFTCDTCSGTFCLEHHTTDSHNCLPQENKSAGVSGGVPLSKQCGLSGCRKTEILDVICPHCQCQFCLQHRHPQDHACTAFKSARNTPSITETQKLNQKYKELSTSSPVKGKGHKSKATAAKVQLMRLKLKATGEAGVPQEEKVFFVIQLPERYSGKEIDRYFSKHWAVGKMIDWLAKTEKLNNHNHDSAAEQLRLFSDQESLVPLSTSLSSLLDSNTVLTGDTLRLEYVPGQSRSS